MRLYSSCSKPSCTWRTLAVKLHVRGACSARHWCVFRCVVFVLCGEAYSPPLAAPYIRPKQLFILIRGTSLDAIVCQLFCCRLRCTSTVCLVAAPVSQPCFCSNLCSLSVLLQHLSNCCPCRTIAVHPAYDLFCFSWLDVFCLRLRQPPRCDLTCNPLWVRQSLVPLFNPMGILIHRPMSLSSLMYRTCTLSSRGGPRPSTLRRDLMRALLTSEKFVTAWKTPAPELALLPSPSRMSFPLKTSLSSVPTP